MSEESEKRPNDHIVCQLIKLGVYQYTLFCVDSGRVNALMWGSHGKGERGKQRIEYFKIAGCFVPKYARRRGHAVALVKFILEHNASVLQTECGSDEGGLAFIKRLGFVFNPQTALWTLTRKQFAEYEKKQNQRVKK